MILPKDFHYTSVVSWQRKNASATVSWYRHRYHREPINPSVSRLRDHWHKQKDNRRRSERLSFVFYYGRPTFPDILPAIVTRLFAINRRRPNNWRYFVLNGTHLRPYRRFLIAAFFPAFAALLPLLVWLTKIRQWKKKNFKSATEKLIDWKKVREI